MDFKALLAEEKTLGKNAAAAYRVDAFEKIDRQLDSIRDEEKLMELTENAYIDRGTLGVKDKADTYGIICPYTYVDAFFYGSGLVTVNTGRDG